MSARGGVLFVFFSRMLLISSGLYVCLCVCAWVYICVPLCVHICACVCAEGKVKSGQHEWD